MTDRTPDNENGRPWEELAEHVGNDDGLAATRQLKNLGPEEQRLAVSRLDGAERSHLVEILDSESAAHLIENLPEVQAADLLEEIPADAAADIVEELPDKVGVGLLREMAQGDAEAVLARLDDPTEAEHLRERSTYSAETAGGLMTDTFAAFPESSSVGDVLLDLSENAEQYSDMGVQYVYVLGGSGELRGVLRLRDLVLTPRSKPTLQVMVPDPISVGVDDDLDSLLDRFGEKSYIGLPVVDRKGILLGVVTRQAVQEATADRQTEDYLHVSGIIGGEELRSMPLGLRSRRRLAWLIPNIVLNLIAASVIAMYEDTLQAVIALAVFLPIISDMSGCSGNQAVAVSIRELSLGLIRPREFLRILQKEWLVGLMNGLALGLLLGTLAAVWKGNIWLGLVVGGALAANTLLAVLLGGMVPLLLKKFRADPALASGPILTTCTDMCGFFLVLSLASTVLPKLT